MENISSCKSISVTKPTDKENKKKKKTDRKVEKKRIVAEVFTDYCASTSLHGMGYLGAQDKNLFEKIWWIIVFILSLLACSYLITKTWIKWKTDPVILSFEKEQIPIWEVPFPAVTICPVNKVVQTRYNYTEKFRNRNNLSEDEHKEFWDVTLICNLEQYPFAEINCTFDTTDQEAIYNIIENAPSLVSTFMDTKWQNNRLPYWEIFSKTITKEGLCFTFNALSSENLFNEGFFIPGDSGDINMYEDSQMIRESGDSDDKGKNVDWTVEHGYNNYIKTSDYPRRTAHDGISSGLAILLHSFKTDVDYVCGMPTTGYKIILHNPVEIPREAEQYILVPANRKANIVVQPELTKTSESLRFLPVETRNCYFSEEKSLRFFRNYTQSNCELECTANVTNKLCNCTPFYLPQAINATICGFGKYKCIKEVENSIIDAEMADLSNTVKRDEERIKLTREIYNQCNCLPSCSSLEYHSEISQSDYHFMETIIASGLYEDEIPADVQELLRSGNMRVSHVDIFFKASQFYALKRSEMYGQVEFLANVGGLLGLFMGFSILSVLEVVYFITIRLWFKYNDKRKI